MQKTTYAFTLLISLFLASCASGYKHIEPASLKYASRNTAQGVDLSYKYELLRKKYAKKESKNGVKIVAVKIDNKTSKDLVFGQNVFLAYSNGDQARPMEIETAFEELKQSPASHLLYLLLTPLQLTTSNTSDGITENTGSFPVGLIVGPGIALTNVLVSSNANKKFKAELQEYSLVNKTIPAGQTIYGLIPLRLDSFEALTIKMD